MVISGRGTSGEKAQIVQFLRVKMAPKKKPNETSKKTDAKKKDKTIEVRIVSIRLETKL